MKHGRLIDYRNGCRCEECREANKAYHRDYRRRKREGMRPTHHVRVEVVGEHVDKLIAAGMGQKTIARLAGVTPGTVHRIHHRQIERVWPRTADRILGITLTDLPDDGLLPAWPTQRLLVELRKAGLTRSEISRALAHESPTNLAYLLGPQHVRKATKRKVEVLYRLAAREGLVSPAVLKEVAS